MSDPIFFPRSGGLTLAEVARIAGASLPAGADEKQRIAGVAPIEFAAPDELIFLDSAKYAERLGGSAAKACLVSEALRARVPARMIALTVPSAYRAFVAVAHALHPSASRPSSLFSGEGAAPGAQIHPAARLESGVVVDPGAAIGAEAEIGSGTVIGSNAVIGPQVRIGRNCSIGGNCTITHALIGDRVIVHAGCQIGQDGFGFLLGEERHTKVPQLGRVIVQDDVEIGAGSAIDRGSIRDTVIGEGTKIDNLVHVGHNCAIGRHCILAAQASLSGSVTLEDFVVLATRVCVYDHVTIGEGARAAAACVVTRDAQPDARLGGWPAKPVTQWLREVATLERLAGRGDDKGAP